jgi:DNA-binding beta-propeller fold protein YncE
MGLDSAAGVAVSGDGASVYVASQLSDAVAVFDRDPAAGALSQKAGAAACVSETGTGPCRDGRALDGAIGIAVSPDGRTVYVASTASDAIAIFTRRRTGGLRQLRGSAGCVSETGRGPCRDGVALDFARDLALSPDGKSVYIASARSDAVAILPTSASPRR